MDDKGVGLELDAFLCFAVYSANNAFARFYRPKLEALGLTYPQYLVMVTLWEKDGQTVGEIGSRLFLESNTLTPLLKRLEVMGLIKRQRSRADERQVVASLTPQGFALKAKAEALPPAILTATGLDKEAASAVRQQLVLLREALTTAA
jgi:MarR family transcriptional regulator, organic hydroperoxide resistance regulator